MQHKWLIASILIIFELGLCAVMLIASGTAVARFQQAGVQMRLFRSDSYSAEAEEEHSFSVVPPAKLVVSNSNGNITVLPGTENVIVVHMRKKAWGSSQAEALQALDALKTDIKQDGNTVTVHPPSEPDKVVIFGSSRSASTDLTIRVPVNSAVNAQNTFGSITLSGTDGDVALRTNAGSIDAADVSGNLQLHTRFGSITAQDVTAGTFTAGSNSGEITLTNVNAAGDTSVTNSLGAIRFNGGDAANLIVKGDAGALSLTNLTVRGGITGSTRLGSLELNRVQAESYTLHSRSGEILVDGARGTLEAETDLGDVEVTHGSLVNLDLRSNSGSLEFSGSLGSGPHTLRTRLGDVRLNLPAASALTFDFETNLGQLNSAFPITQSNALGNKHLTGTINGGGAQLTARSDNGNIHLDILNPQEAGHMDGILAMMTILGFFVLLFGFIVLMRYLSYRETLVLAEKGLVRPDLSRDNGKGTLRWGIAIASLGLAICIGLYPIGWLGGGGFYPLNFGPWMLAGLLPLFFGLGLVLIYVLTSEDKSRSENNQTATPMTSVEVVSAKAMDESTTEIDLPATR